MNKPFFSIVIPVFNSSGVVLDALDSVLAQSFKDYEIIIINDGSTDQTKLIVEDYFLKKKFSNYLHIDYLENKGISYARNLGIKSARAEFIAFLDADDIWYKRKLEKVHKIFSERVDVDLVCHDEYYIKNKAIIKEARYNPDTENIFDYLLFESNCISTSATTVRKTKLIEAGMFSVTLSMAEDYDLWLRLARIAKFYFLEEFLGEYRIRPDSIISKLEEFIDCELRVLNSNFNNHKRNKFTYENFKFQRRKSIIYFETALNSYHRGMWKNSIKYCLKSIYRYPFLLQAYIVLFRKGDNRL